MCYNYCFESFKVQKEGAKLMWLFGENGVVFFYRLLIFILGRRICV